MKKFFKTHAKLCIAVLALALVTVGGTLALMVTSPKALLNNFTAASIDTEINEVVGEGTKQVKIKNHGPSDAYVRARIMVSGVSKEKVKIVDEEPAVNAIETDCVYLVMQNNANSAGRWYKDQEPEKYSDDFYYYLGVLPDGGSTKELLSKVIIGKDLQSNDEFLEQFTVTVYHESVLAIEQPEEGQTVNLAMVQRAFTNAVPTTTPGT
ncbi:hypothetical protein [Allofournierella massiliensis]|uniref:hypothetical protein n=1 Tax=Allofournierella massiliensis TaxID=1650663 RepID=UPI0024B0C901|nr:hypothetical protein [Fournierella massiliensis]